jgi:hypothetical protein
LKLQQAVIAQAEAEISSDRAAVSFVAKDQARYQKLVTISPP